MNRPRLLYQLVSPLHRSAGPGEIARRLAMLQAWAPSLAIEIASPEEGPAAVQSAADIAMVFPALKDAASGWKTKGYDAVVIGCFSDPATEALQEISGVPVIGPGEAAMLAAVQIGERFSVLSSDPTPPGLRRRIRGIGIEPMFLSEVMVGGSVADLVREPDRHFAAAAERARACTEAGANVLVLGCLALSFAPGMPERLTEITGVPVVNSVLAGLKAAEARLAYSGRLAGDRGSADGALDKLHGEART
ncbi:aspartate/glutamate racemase family protein [Hartmannibacter diazotrophicus]|uniref:aspartate/glutamate racemase family protein n=1 Tax=Hartmannibacter diazotrophicus TaxID=1482074 RepID=UPI001AECA5B6|nr:aspartate/glutamate racemase family protein [Hartmannibacter diazotrophicus]